VFSRCTPGAEIEFAIFGAPTSAGVFSTQDGKVMRLVLYFDRDRALADLGREA
jgi:hypothetical protein